MTIQSIIDKANHQWRVCHQAVDTLLQMQEHVPNLAQQNADLTQEKSDLEAKIALLLQKMSDIEPQVVQQEQRLAEQADELSQAHQTIATLEEQCKNTIAQEKFDAILQAHEAAFIAQKEQFAHNIAQEVASEVAIACSALRAEHEEALESLRAEHAMTIATFDAQKLQLEQQIQQLTAQLAEQHAATEQHIAEAQQAAQHNKQAEIEQETASIRLAARDEIDAVRLAAREEIAIVQITANDELERLRADLAVVRRERDIALKHGHPVDNTLEQQRMHSERKRLADSIKKTEHLSQEVHRLLATFGVGKSETAIIHTPIKEVAA